MWLQQSLIYSVYLNLIISNATCWPCTSFVTFMSSAGRHVTAAEALKLGIVDQVIDRNTVDAAVKFALSVRGETQKKTKTRRNKMTSAIKSTPTWLV